MKLSRDQVKHVAKLANLPLTDAQLEEYSQQLSKILDYIDKLNLVDTKDTDPTFNITPNKNIWREDKTSADQTIPQDGVLQNAAQKRDGYIVTKGVFNEE